MKAIMLTGCLALGLVGCASQRGATGNVYETEYGTGWGSGTASTVYYAPQDNIYPVRRQPSIQGDSMADPRPMIDPSREWDMTYRTDIPSREIVVAPRRDVVIQTAPSDEPRATSPRDPIFNR